MPTDLEIAYAAGIFDGEGYVGVNKHNQGYFLQVVIAQKDGSLIEWIDDRWEGGFGQRSNGIYYWRAYADKGRKFLRDVLPYLIVKKPQVEYILPIPQPFREEHMLELKRLKKVYLEAIR